VSLTADQWQALKPKVDPTSILVAINSPPVVTFKVTDDKGNPVVGLGGQYKASTDLVPTNYNIAFTLAKLVPGANNEPGKWVSYLITKAGTVAAPATVGTYPTSDSQGTLVDNGDGSYKYTFYRDVKLAKAFVDGLADDAAAGKLKADLGDVSYDPTLTHRLGIIISGSQPGTGTNTPTKVQSVPPVPLLNTFNIGYDFVPAGGAVTATRDIVVKDSCSSCHDGRAIGHISTTSATNGVPPGAFVGRNDPRLCVTCHTDQTKYGFTEVTKTATGYSGTYGRVNGEAAFTFPRMVHQFHMGSDLLKTGYNLNLHCNDPREPLTYNPAKPVANSAACFNTVGLPQSPTNCTTCHDGSATKSDGSVNLKKTANGDNWKNVPSIVACGSCHDGINFADGTGTTLAGATTGHVGGAKANNATCVLCHDATTIPVYHRTTIASLNNPVLKAGVAKFEYKISSVTINASKQAVVKFQVLKDGTPVAFNAYAAGAVPITGFTGGPGFMVAYATGQDGIAAPADWNSGHDTLSLTDAWAGVNGNVLSAPDANNTYTVTIAASSTGRSASHSLTLPADAKMVTGLMAGAFTDANANALPGVPAMVAATGNTPDGKANVARRVIFSEAKCNTCHDRLGTSPNFHGGNYSIAMCAACHTPNQGGSTGWSASFRVWVHGIHSASKRTVPFTWHAVSATDTYAGLGYPGVLKDCNQCHLPGTADFSASQYTATDAAGMTIVDKMLNVQAATGVLNPASATNYVFPQLAPVGSGNYTYGLMVDNVTSYGTGNSIDPATGLLVTQTNQSINLVTSPITAACSTCHDTAKAISHMTTTGYGSFYKARSAVVAAPKEQCLTCHGAGAILPIADVHK